MCRLGATELQRGDAYKKLPKLVGIDVGTCTLDYTLFPDRDDLLSTYCLCDKRHEAGLPDILAMHFVELSKFSEIKPRNLATPFEKWLQAL